MKQFKIPLNILLKEISLEGENTANDVINAIKNLQKLCDVIIIIRGGGFTINISNSFDKIEIYEAIKQSQIPVMTAIGHEDDKDDKLLITNISDFDFPTPSTAANNINKKFINPIITNLQNLSIEMKKMLDRDLYSKINKKYEILSEIFDNIFNNLFDGTIYCIDDNVEYIIVKKNKKYYKCVIEDKNEIKLDEKKIKLKDDIIQFIQDENISEIENIIENNDEFNDENINNIVTDIKKLEKMQDKNENLVAEKNDLYCKLFEFNQKNYSKKYKIICWYIECLKDIENINKTQEEIKEIYDITLSLLSKK